MINTCFLLLLLAPISINAMLRQDLEFKLANDLDALQARTAQLKTVGAELNKTIIYNGLIGVSVADLLANHTNHALEHNGTCAFHGNGPLCKVTCDDGYFETLRTKTVDWNSTTFAWTCWSGKLSYCCRMDLANNRWGGKWLNVKTNKDMWCKYAPEGDCGTLYCIEGGKESTSPIYGDHCERVTLFGSSRRALNGTLSVGHAATDNNLKPSGNAALDALNSIEYRKNDDLSI